MPELGHIAYYVRNLERSVAFYEKVVGLTVVGRIFNGRAAVLSGGHSHHELLLIQVSTADGPLVGRRIGLYHAGWKVGNSLTELKEALDRAQLYGYNVDSATDHKMMFSLYLRDPDDNEVELFVDDPEYDWKQDNSWMEAPVRPLDISTCLTRSGKSSVNINKTAARQAPLTKFVPSPPPVQEDQVQLTQAREPLQPASQNVPTQLMGQGQVQVSTRAQQLLLHAQLGEVKPDKVKVTNNPVSAPRQNTGNSELSADLLPGQSRPPSESSVKVHNELELEQKQKQEQKTNLTQNLNQVAQSQPDMGYGDIMQNMPHVNRQFDDNMLSTPPQFSDEQLITTVSSSDDEEAQYPMEHVAA